jgi:hypothetical protein
LSIHSPINKQFVSEALRIITKIGPCIRRYVFENKCNHFTRCGANLIKGKTAKITTTFDETTKITMRFSKLQK